MLKIDKNRVLAPKKSFYKFSQSLWALSPSRSQCSRSVCSRLRFSLKMAESAKRAIILLEETTTRRQEDWSNNEMHYPGQAH